jgi:hypothetical protein
MSEFPVDDTTLVLLAAACQMNPDSGHTELMTFLDMGTRVKSETLIEGGEVPTYFVEHEPGYEPFSPHEVIRALVAEVQRLRALLGEETMTEPCLTDTHSGVVQGGWYCGFARWPDKTLWQCDHRHRGAKEARECASRAATSQSYARRHELTASPHQGKQETEG